MKEVATGDTVGVFAGKSWGGKHPLCVRLITVGKVAVCKKKETTNTNTDFFVFQLNPAPTVSLKLVSFNLSFTFNKSYISRRLMK